MATGTNNSAKQDEKPDPESVVRQWFAQTQASCEDMDLLIGFLDYLDDVFRKQKIAVYRWPIADDFYNHVHTMLPFVFAFETTINKKINLLNTCGWFMFGMRKKEDALACYDEALKLDKNWHVLYLNKGLVYDVCDELENAIEQYKMAIALNPVNPDYYGLLAEACRNNWQYGDAFDGYKNIVAYTDAADKKQEANRKKAVIWMRYLERKMELFGRVDTGERRSVVISTGTPPEGGIL